MDIHPPTQALTLTDTLTHTDGLRTRTQTHTHTTAPKNLLVAWPSFHPPIHVRPKLPPSLEPAAIGRDSEEDLVYATYWQSDWVKVGHFVMHPFAGVCPLPLFPTLPLPRPANWYGWLATTSTSDPPSTTPTTFTTVRYQPLRDPQRQGPGLGGVGVWVEVGQGQD